MNFFEVTNANGVMTRPVGFDESQCLKSLPLVTWETLCGCRIDWLVFRRVFHNSESWNGGRPRDN